MRRRPQITIDVVAAEAGVSASTVSHVLNGRSDTARISAATSQRVRDAASRLGYTPNHAARSLRRQRTGIISVLAWRLSSPFFADIATGVRNVAQHHGFQVGVIDAGALDREVEIRALQHLRTGISDGVVVATGTHSRGGPATEALRELAEIGIPVSLVLDRSPGPNIPALDVDHAGGGYLATRHLLDLGHRRIAHFTFSDAPLEFEGGRLMAHTFVECFPDPATRPTAITAFNDRTAIGVIRGFYEAGVRVPQDVALIGFHDIPTARYTTPALTTIGHPLIELGEMAADSLFTLLNGGEVEQLDHTIPVSLVVRESCGASAPPAWRASPPHAPTLHVPAGTSTLLGEPHA